MALQAAVAEKTRVAFQIYDLGGTNSIRREEVQEMLLSMVAGYSELTLSPEAVEAILDNTFKKVPPAV